MIEVYATTLHYAPCQTSAKGFRCVVVLPKGTNGELSHRPENKSGEEKLLAAVNKWLIGHEAVSYTHLISPSSAFSNPIRMRNKVVFPVPEGLIRQ